MDRSNFLGGSDAAGVLGKSRWDTPLAVWARKTGQIEDSRTESEEAEHGKGLEEYVAQCFTKKTGKKLVHKSDTIFHPSYEFIGGSIDRYVEGEDAILECKTASAWKAKEWDGEEIPQEYIIQCYHYLLVTGKKRCYIAVLIGGQRFKWKVIERDEKVLKDLLQREVSFWHEFVLSGIMPTTISRIDTETLDALFPLATEPETGTVLSDEANIRVENLIAMKQDLKNLEGQIERLENELKQMLGTNSEGRTGIYLIRWKNMRVARFDTKLFAADYPDLIHKYKPVKIQRRFDYKPLEEATNESK